MNEQDIYDKAYGIIQELGYKIYPYKQMNDVGYPFVEVSNTQIDRLPTKSGSIGTVLLSVDVWGLAKKRKEFSTIKSEIIASLIQNFSVREGDIDDRTITDTTTKDVLLHGVLVVPIYMK